MNARTWTRGTGVLFAAITALALGGCDLAGRSINGRVLAGAAPIVTIVDDNDSRLKTPGTEGVEVEVLDLGEDGVHLRREHGLAVLHLDALAIDRGGVRGDLFGGEGADHLQDVLVGGDGLVARRVAAGGLVVLLDEGDDRGPVDATLEVEEKVVVVCEVVGQGDAPLLHGTGS